MSDRVYKHITEDEKSELKANFAKLKFTHDHQFTYENLQTRAYPYLLYYNNIVDFYPLHLQGKKSDEINWSSLTKTLAKFKIHHVESHDTFDKLIKIQTILRAFNIDYCLWGDVIKQCCLHHTILTDFKNYKNYNTYDHVVTYLMHPQFVQNNYNFRNIKLNDKKMYSWLNCYPKKKKKKTDLTRYYIEWLEQVLSFPEIIKETMFKRIKDDMLETLKPLDSGKHELLENIPDYKWLFLTTKFMFAKSTEFDPKYFRNSDLQGSGEDEYIVPDFEIEVKQTDKLFFHNLPAYDQVGLIESPIYKNIKKYFPNFILYENIFDSLPGHLEGYDISKIDWTNMAKELQYYRFKGGPQLYKYQNRSVEMNNIIGTQRVFCQYKVNYMLWGIIMKHYCIDIDLLHYMKGYDTFDQVLTCLFKYFDFEKYHDWHLQYISKHPDHKLKNLPRARYYMEWADKMEESYFHPESFDIIKTDMLKHCKSRSRREINNAVDWKELKLVILGMKGSSTHIRVDLQLKRYIKKHTPK